MLLKLEIIWIRISQFIKIQNDINFFLNTVYLIYNLTYVNPVSLFDNHTLSNKMLLIILTSLFSNNKFFNPDNVK